MSGLLGAVLLGAAAAVTWLHLSARARRRGRPFPSVQHLGGTLLPRRPTWPVEQPLRLLLRLGTLLLLALALWGLRLGGSGGEPRIALVDPASGAEGWRRARALAGVSIVAGFDAGRARVEGDEARAARVRASLEACSARPIDCLLRAAHAGEGRPVVVGSFVDGAWSAALAGESFDFVRLAPVTEGRTGAATAPAPPDTPAVGSTEQPRAPPTPGIAPAAALWRAALEAARAPAPRGGVATSLLPELRVLTEAGPARAPCPAVEQTDARALRWAGLSKLATARTAMPAGATLRFREEPGATRLLDGIAARASDGTLCLASTERELGRWAHDGTLVVLGRALQPWVAPPLVLRQAPPGGTERWLDATGAPAAVGLSDVAPGAYRRADGPVLLSLARPEALAPAALTDADLVARGGAPWSGGTSSGWAWPLWVLLGVGLLRLLDLPEPGRSLAPSQAAPSQAASKTPAVLAVGAQVAGLAILAAAVLGLGWGRSRLPERWIRILGPVTAAEEAPLAAAGLHPVRGRAPLTCTAPAADSPCVEVARASTQLQPGVDTHVIDAAAPRVSVLDVQLPAEVPLGMAALVRVDLRVQRGRGLTATVEARAPGAPPASTQRLVDSDDAVVRLELPLLPASEGVLPIAVSARVGTAADGRLLALAVRRRVVRRLILAGAPSWDARRAAELLDLSPARVDTVTRVGRTATASRPRSLMAPAALLTAPDALDAYASIVLVDAGDWLGPAALAGLAAWVERGGGLVVLGRARLPPTLVPGPTPAGPAGPPHRLHGRWNGNGWSFDGFDAAEGPLAPGTVVLGALGPSERALRPWVVGRTAGRGRVLQFLAEDAWRLSPPGGDAARLATLLGAAVAWVEAARPAQAVTVTEDARSVLWTDDAGSHRTPFGLGESVFGLAMANLPAGLDLPIRLRGEAASAGKPWIDVNSWSELAEAWGRAPVPATLRWQERVRNHPGTWVLWAALLIGEIALRRGRRHPRPFATEAPDLGEEEALRRSA